MWWVGSERLLHILARQMHVDGTFTHPFAMVLLDDLVECYVGLDVPEDAIDTAKGTNAAHAGKHSLV